MKGCSPEYMRDLYYDGYPTHFSVQRVLGLGKLKAILHEKDLPDDYLKELLEDTLPTMFSDFKPITRKDGRKDTSTARRIKQSGRNFFNTNAIYTSHKNYKMSKNTLIHMKADEDIENFGTEMNTWLRRAHSRKC